MPQLLNEIQESEIEKYLTDDNWCAQEKFDGRRKMIIRTYAKTEGANRKGLVITLDEVFLNEIENLPSVITLDGEDLGSKLIIFDVIDDEHKDLPYEKRYEYLDEIWREVTEKGKFTSMDLIDTAWSTSQKRALYKQLQKDGKEGIVFKDIRASYSPGRPASGGSQVKFKFYDSCSCIVTGINHTKRSISLGLYKEDIVDVGNCTVYPNQDVPKAGSVVEVKYLYAYKEGSLYQPILLGERSDIEPHECLLSQLKYKKDERST